MDSLWSFDNIKALQNLLKNPEDDEPDSDHEDKHPNAMAKMKPSDIGPKKTKTTEAKGDENEKKKNLEDIWDVDEIPEGTQFEDVHDPRPQPEYELFYKQSVTTEDIYLQMGMKNPTTASCEFLVARIKLPETKSEDIKLDVKDKFLDLRTPKFKLGLYLPNPVDPDSSKANWSEDKEVLEVVMRNKREYDFLNE